MIRVFVDRLDFGPCKHENPQAEARATEAPPQLCYFHLDS
jgi:hypothetical protein